MLKIAERWYERKVIDDAITLIYEPHVHQFLRCNIWHLRGRDRDLLIDTGLGVASLKDAIADLIDKPLLALATHIHYDHVGCLHEFDQRLIHAAEAHRLSPYQEFCGLRIDDFPASYHADLTTEEYPELLVSARPSAEFDPGSYQVQATTATGTLADRDIIDLGNRHLAVMHLPGHSPGSIGLWEAETGTLFAGDALYDGALLDELPDSSIPDYCTTMARLRNLPVEVVHGGHNPSFGQDRMLTLIDAYLAWRSA